jgi:ATP-dependent exoDNAse (exonuclease V) beta subunit
MAELHRVEINEKVSSEIEPEEKQQADETVETPEEQQSERPEWLPEKFKSAEDMANAYSELEKKLGQPAAEEQQEEEQPQQEETENDNDKPEAGNYNEAVVEASQEFFANDGQLSDETYQKLEQVGLPRDLVDSYAAGQQALLQSEETQIKGVAGGDYDAMAEWANEHLPSEEIDAFDEAVTSGSVQQAKLAVQGLHARYQNATGSRPKTLVQGAVSGSSTMPFKSMQELARAQSDPRYRSGDKAYHQEIDRRLAVSNI